MRLLVLLVLAGCLTPNEVVCGDGTVCPGGTTCKTVGDPGRTVCASPTQLADCANGQVACTYAGMPGACESGVCLPSACGNAFIDPGEMCDDGNTSALDGCSADCRSTEVCRNGALDAFFGEQCDDGNGRGHDGCSAGCAREVPTWAAVHDIRVDERPSRVFRMRISYDSRRQRVVMFGGVEDVGTGVRITYDYTREWTGTRWIQMSTPTRPPARASYQLAYHAQTGKTVLFSGANGANDTWLWDGVRWSVAEPTMAPPARQDAAMAYDSTRNRIIMFGGSTSRFGANAIGDTWAWTGTDWQPITSSMSPSPRLGAQMAYDPKRDRVVLYGGVGSTTFSDLWELDGNGTWNPIGFASAPGARSFGLMAYDPISQHVILIGGNATSPAEVWDWDGTSWMKRPTSFPVGVSEGSGNSATTDSVRGRVIAWASEALYELDGTTWRSPVAGAATDPSFEMTGRENGTYVLDPVRQHVVGFGGVDDVLGEEGDTWFWNGGWTDAGATLPARFGATGVFDAARRDVLMFGGCSQSSGFHSETFTFDTAWHQQFPAQPPGPRCLHAMAYDVVRREVVMFGGLTPAGATDETYVWDGMAWSLRSPAHKPTPLYGAAMAYDEDRKAIVMFGGRGGALMATNQTWMWDGTDWTQLAPSSPPIPRYAANAAWDSARRRIVLFGGSSAAGDVLNDVYEWDGQAWRLVPTQGGPAVDSFGMTPDLDGGVLVFHGALRRAGTVQGREFTVWRLRYDAGVPTETCTNVDEDGDGQVGCADTDCALVCTPCGDGMCDPTAETCALCPADCGACPP